MVLCGTADKGSAAFFGPVPCTLTLRRLRWGSRQRATQAGSDAALQPGVSPPPPPRASPNKLGGLPDARAARATAMAALQREANAMWESVAAAPDATPPEAAPAGRRERKSGVGHARRPRAAPEKTDPLARLAALGV